MKKAICGLSLFMALFLLSCSGSKDKGGASSQEGADKTYSYEWFSNYLVDPDGAIVKIMEEKFNVDFNMLEPGEGLNVRLAAGEIPDVFQTYAVDYRKFAEDGILAEIPWDMIKTHAPKIYAAYSSILSDEELHRTEINGINYGIDVLDGETGGTRSLIVYRGDWIEKVGGKVPETLSEFEDLMYKFTRNDPDGDGKNNTYGLSASMMDAVYGAYGYLPGLWTKKNGQIVNGSIQPEMKDALTLLAKWYKDGVLHPEWVTGEHTSGDWAVSNQFVSGQIGVSAQGQYVHWRPITGEGQREGNNITELKVSNPAAVDKLVYGKPPVGPTGQSGLSKTTNLHSRFITFGAHMTDDPDKMIRALQILDYAIADDDGFTLTRFGVEGTHWNRGPDNIPLAIGDYTVWAQISLEGGGIDFTFGSWLKPYIEKINLEYAWAKSLPISVEENGISNALFFAPPSNAEYGTELAKIRDEAYVDIITGRQPISYFDTFVANWKKAGGDILTKEANQ